MVLWNVFIFYYSKLVNNLETLVSPPNKRSTNSTFSFNPSILSVF